MNSKGRVIERGGLYLHLNWDRYTRVSRWVGGTRNRYERKDEKAGCGKSGRPCAYTFSFLSLQGVTTYQPHRQAASASITCDTNEVPTIVDIYTQNKILIKFNNKLSKPVEINKGVRQGCPLSSTL